jgi:7-carboxy-7-deazaguanine synthase
VTQSLPVVQEKKLTIPVTELYTGVLQGEGISSGMPCSFIRLTGCHRKCAWCDATNTWKPGQIETSRKTPREVFEYLMAGKPRRLIITGGEPLMHQDKAYFNALLDLLEKTEEWVYEVETEGLHVPNERLEQMALNGILQINCSPKLQHAGMGDLTKEYKESGGLEKIFALGGIFKVVVRNEEDVLEAMQMLASCLPFGVESKSPLKLTTLLRDKLWLMPEGNTRTSQLEKLDLIYDLSCKYAVCFSPRIHVLRHDSKKAV